MNALETAYWNLMRTGENQLDQPTPKEPKDILEGFGPYTKRPIKVYYNSGDAIRDNGESNAGSRSNQDRTMEKG